MVMNLLLSLNSWLQHQSGNEISYEALKKILDSSPQVGPEFRLLASPPDFRGFFVDFSLNMPFIHGSRTSGVEQKSPRSVGRSKPLKLTEIRP